MSAASYPWWVVSVCWLVGLGTSITRTKTKENVRRLSPLLGHQWGPSVFFINSRRLAGAPLPSLFSSRFLGQSNNAQQCPTAGLVVLASHGTLYGCDTPPPVLVLCSQLLGSGLKVLFFTM